MSDWQPIETAPRDGTRVLAWNPDLNYAVIVQNKESSGTGRLWYPEHRVSPIRVSHWQPLPAPPSEGE